MKILKAIFILFLITNIGFSQNLVPNPSFEEVNEITNRWSGTASSFNRQIKYWDSPTQGSPDLLFVQNLDKMFPKRPQINLKDHQPRSGKFMIAIKTFGCKNAMLHCKEYIQIKLKSPLKSGEQYLYEYWVNPTKLSIKNNNLGIALSTKRQKDLTISGLFPLIPISKEENIIKAPPNDWQRISGTFTVDSAYQYLIIGNFNDDEETQSIIEENGLEYGFYLVDDVSLKPLYSKQEEKDLEVGQTVVLEQVYFDFNQADLLASSFAALDKVFEILQKHPSMNIEIRGHTDNIGTATYNLDLSHRRAKAVADFLIKKGIHEARIQSKGYGSAYPILANDTVENREINRRVEFRVEKK